MFEVQWDIGYILLRTAVFLFLFVSSISDYRSRTVSMRWIELWMAAGIGLNIYKVCLGNLTIHELLCAILPGVGLLMVAYFTGAAGGGDGFAWLIVGLLWDSVDCLGAFAASLILIFVWSVGVVALKRAGRKTRLPFLPFSFAGTVLWTVAVSFGVFAPDL